MTARIGKLTKLDHAINATLSIAYVAAAGGDNVGLVAFSRRIVSYLPPRRGHEQINRVMEALYAIEPQMIEPSYARAFNFFSANCPRRSLVVILTDLVDRDASAELLAHTRKLCLGTSVDRASRHGPRELVRSRPSSTVESTGRSDGEILHQRGRHWNGFGRQGARAGVPRGGVDELVNNNLEVKERGVMKELWMMVVRVPSAASRNLGTVLAADQVNEHLQRALDPFLEVHRQHQPVSAYRDL